MRLPKQSMSVDRIRRDVPPLEGTIGPSAVGEFGHGLWCTDESCLSLKIACKNGGGTWSDSGGSVPSLGACWVGQSQGPKFSATPRQSPHARHLWEPFGPVFAPNCIPNCLCVTREGCPCCESLL